MFSPVPLNGSKSDESVQPFPATNLSKAATIVSRSDGNVLKEVQPAKTITQADDDDDEDDEEEEDEEDDTDTNYLTDTSETSEDSEFSDLTGLSDLSGREWKPVMKPSLWIQKQMKSGANPRDILAQILANGTIISSDLSDISLWRILASMLSEPPQRHKLRTINTIDDVVHLFATCTNIIVLTGAGVSVSCGIPDFRSNDGIYSRLAQDFPDLPDPQAMFDIDYFAKDPRPFFKFAREIYPGQFEPSLCHRFLRLLERNGKLLRNYTQNIDTLEQVAGIENVVECHGSFATASCTQCKYKTNANAIRSDIFAQTIPLCPSCRAARPAGTELSGDKTPPAYSDLFRMGVMKPDIVFFGEGLPDSFHSAIANDKDKCDLLVVIGSSLKVHPVALIPRSIPADIPQILINREQLHQFKFDVELLGDSDTIIAQLCHLLGNDYAHLANGSTVLSESKQLQHRPYQTADENSFLLNADGDSQSTKSAIISGGFCDSGFESTSSSSNLIQKSRHHHHHRYHVKQPVATSIAAPIPPTTTSTDSPFVDRLKQFQQKVTETSSSQRNFSIEPDDCSRSSSNNSPTCDQPIPDSSPHKMDKNRRKSSTTTTTPPPPLPAQTNCVWVSKPPVTNSIAERLCDNTFYRHPKNGIYVFPGAQGPLNSFDSSDDMTTDDDDDICKKSTGQNCSKSNDDEYPPPPIKRNRSNPVI